MKGNLLILNSEPLLESELNLTQSIYCGGTIPLGCGTLWQLWCQSPESGYAQCTLPSSHTVNQGGGIHKKEGKGGGKR